MKNSTFLYSLLFTSFFLFQCKQTEKKETNTTIAIDKDSITVVKKDGFREPFDDEIREFGIIKTIEDGQYPMFVVTVEFVERHTEASFNLNIESISLDATGLHALKGQYATIYYTDEEETMAMDLHHKGKSLLGEYAPEHEKSYKSFTGILSGAENLSGDNAGKITVTNDEGAMSFGYFVDDDTNAVNGKEVTVYYYSRYTQNITYIKKSED